MSVKTIKVYGWEELSECSYFIEGVDFLSESVVFNDKGKVAGYGMNYYKNFSLAKKAEIVEINKKILLWSSIKKEVKQQKMNSI